MHAKAKAEAGYRFYAPYDKISREDILVLKTAKTLALNLSPGLFSIADEVIE